MDGIEKALKELWEADFSEGGCGLPIQPSTLYPRKRNLDIDRVTHAEA